MIEKEHFPTAEKLHTDVLEQKYGPIEALVIRHDNVRESTPGSERIREAKLIDQEGITRTYALTFLTYDKNNAEIVSIDDQIRLGGSIGKTFRENGYEVKKNVIDVFMLPLEEKMKADFQTTDDEAKSRLTEFYAKKENGTPIVYGIVMEVYSPDFKDPKDGINQTDLDQINPLTGTLQSVGVPVDEIWEKLDQATNKEEWGDLKSRYDEASELSKPAVKIIRDKAVKYVTSNK
jgi:hypothetical protein